MKYIRQMLELLQEQARELRSELNANGTREEFRTEWPSEFLMMRHYIHCGRAAMMREVHSDLNRLGAYQRFGEPDPTDEQLWQHYRDCGRQAVLAAVYGDRNYFETGVRFEHDPRKLEDDLRLEKELWANYLAYHPDVAAPPHCTKFFQSLCG